MFLDKEEIFEQINVGYGEDISIKINCIAYNFEGSIDWDKASQMGPHANYLIVH